MIDPLDGGRIRARGVDRRAIDGDDAQLLRLMPEKQREVQVGDRGGIQHAPQLPLPRPHLQCSWRIVGVGHWHVVDGKVFGGLAEARAVVGGIAISVVTLAELFAGAYKRAQPARLLTGIADLLKDLVLLDFDVICAEQFGKVVANAKKGDYLKLYVFSPRASISRFALVHID